jgi:zinc protease
MIQFPPWLDRLIVWLGLLLLAGTSGGAVADAADSQPLTLDPAIRHGRLDNGLTYYIRQNQKPENRAALRLAVNAGSVLEQDDQRGLAHFLEHMAFNGTRSFEKQELVNFLEGIGMRFGPDLNAYTSFDETVYMLEVPLDDPAVFEKAFLVLQEWASALTLDPAEIDKERGVVLEEWRLGRGAQQRILDRQIPVLFHDSLYAERLPIGQPEIIQSAPPEAFHRFYREWYRPNLMAIVAVGDFDPAAVEQLIRKYFNRLENPTDAPARPLVPVADHSETLLSIATDPELSYSSVQIAYKRQALEERLESDYRRMLVEHLYRSMLNDRLDELVQQADPPFLFAGVGEMGLTRSKDIYVQTAVVREGNLERGLTALLLEARRVNRDGFGPGELERSKAELLRNYGQAYNERDKTPSASYAAEYVRHFLDHEPVPGIARELELAQRFLADIPLDEVNRAARQWTSPTNRVILYSAPEKTDVPTPSKHEILEIVRAAETAPIEAYTDNAEDAPLLPRLPDPGKVVSERFHDRVGVTEWQLSNGARVLLKPTDFKNDQLLLRAFSPGGHSLLPDEHYVPASTASTVVGQSGVGAFNAIQLQKKLSGTIARVSAHLDSQFENLSGFASPDDLETFFQLVRLRFTAPRADEEIYLSLQTRLRETIQNRRNNPDAVFEDALTLALYQDHPRHQPLSLETLERMDREQSLRIYRERFADAGDFTFVLVGNFTPETIRPLVERYLASLPAAGRDESGRFNGDDPVRGQHKLTVRRGIEPKCTVRILFTGDTSWNDDARYPLRAAVDVLRIRLREELREDLGGVYGVGVSGNLNRWPKGNYSTGIQFGCDPARADDLIQVALKEIASLQEDGPSDVNLAKVREQHLREFEVGIKENPFWLNNLLFREQHDLPLDELLDFPEKARNLTADDVRNAARKYFAPDNRFIARLLPETGTGATPDDPQVKPEPASDAQSEP